MYWSYVFLALTNRFDLMKYHRNHAYFHNYLVVLDHQQLLSVMWRNSNPMPHNGGVMHRKHDNTVIYWNSRQKGDSWFHYNDVIMGAMASQITSLMTVYSTVYSGANERKHQSSASLAFVRGIHRWPANSPHKCPVTRKIVQLMTSSCLCLKWRHGSLSYFIST